MQPILIKRRLIDSNAPSSLLEGELAYNYTSGAFYIGEVSGTPRNILSAIYMPTGIDAVKISAGDVSNTEFDYLNGLTGNIQGQLDAFDGHLHTGVYSLIDHLHVGVYAPAGHDHSSLYAPIVHDHNTVYYTRTNLNTEAGAEVHWGNLTDFPLPIQSILAGEGDPSVVKDSDFSIWDVQDATVYSYQDVAYGNGVYVRVGTTNNGANGIQTSTDGIAWTTQNSGTSTAWQHIVYGAGLFVAGAYTNSSQNIMTSPDGITWTVRITPNAALILDLIYADSLFVAVQHDVVTDQVMTSIDGITWTARTSPGFSQRGIAYGAGVFVAVGSTSGETTTVMTSPDGAVWTARTPAATIRDWHKVAYGAGYFVAVSGQNSRTESHIMRSADGITWESISSPEGYVFNDIEFGNGAFKAIGQVQAGETWDADDPAFIYTSDDGETWISEATDTDRTYYSLAFTNDLFFAFQLSAEKHMAIRTPNSTQQYLATADAIGDYGIIPNFSDNWNTGYAHSQSTHGDADADNTAANETSHADVLVDGEFVLAGIMATDGAGGYSILEDNAINWNLAHGWGDHSLATYVTDAVLAAWTGSSAITTVGTLGTGDIPWSLLSSTPTTVSGYGITDVYTKANMQGDGAAALHWNNLTNLPAAISTVDERLAAVQEPTGFPDGPADTNMTFTEGTRTFSITPSGADYNFWILGVQHTISTEKTIVIPDTEGMHHIYFDTDGELAQTTTFDPHVVIGEKVYVCNIYWDATNSEAVVFGDERHGLMPWQIHLLWHDTMGTQHTNGMTIADIVADGNGNDDTHCQMSVSVGVMTDEDLPLTLTALTAPASIPVIYRTGASGDWRKDVARTAPVKQGASLLAYNEWTGATWQQTELTNNKYVLAHIVASNDHRAGHEYVAVQGQQVYGSSTDAREGANTEINNLIVSGIPFQEFVFVGTIIYKVSTSDSNTFKAAIVSTDTGADYVDWRTTALSPGVSPTSHANLTETALPNSHPAAAIATDTTNFNGNLTATEDTVQKALEALDDMATSGGTASGTSADTASFGGALSAADDTVQKALDTLDDHGHDFSSLGNKPTTVSGYGITDAMTTAHDVNGVVTQDITNWDTAFGWGDHSGYSYATETYVGTQITNLIDASPAALDTLNELAAALGDDPNFATTMSTALGLKMPYTGGQFTGNIEIYKDSGQVQLKLRSDPAESGALYFTDAPTGYGGSIAYNHATDVLTFNVAAALAITISSSQVVDFENTPTVSSTAVSLEGHTHGGDSTLTTTAFDGILSAADTNVQLAMDTVDDHVHTFAQVTSKPTTISGFGITDAMTTSHDANAVTTAAIANWNTAYGWGGHAGLYMLVDDDAAAVTTAKISNWDTAYGWGDHAGLYMLVDDDASAVTTAKISNWDTAYGWGNHASASYLVAADLSNYTQKGVGETVTGGWTFSTTPSFTNHATIGQANNANHYLYINSGDGSNVKESGILFQHNGLNKWEIYKQSTSSNFSIYSYDSTATSLTIDGSTNILNFTNTPTAGGTAVSLVGHVHTFASLTSKPTTVSGFGITDAMTTAHDANAVTTAAIANWNTAYGWGDYSTGDHTVTGIWSFYSGGANNNFYVGRNSLERLRILVDDYDLIMNHDQDETTEDHDWVFDQSFSTTGAASFIWKYNGGAIMTLTKAGVLTWSGGGSANANTAYGWGDHGAEGYLTSASLANFANLTEDETITGTWKFNNTLDIGDGTASTMLRLLGNSGDPDNMLRMYYQYNSDTGISTADPAIRFHAVNNADANTKVQLELYDGTAYTTVIRASETSEFGGGATFAGGLTATGYNNSNWDTAYGWGDHAGVYTPISHNTLTNNPHSVTAAQANAMSTEHAANGITNVGSGLVVTGTERSNWNTAHGWGNHNALYMVVDHDASAVTSTKIGYWDTAYGWGDHASGGYQSATTWTTNADLSVRGSSAPDTVGDAAGVTASYLSSNGPAGTDHSLLTLAYSGTWQTQIAQDWRNAGRMFVRGQNNGTWSDWYQQWDASDFSSTDVANGATAHGWGDHSAAGYATAALYLPLAGGILTGTVRHQGADLWVKTDTGDDVGVRIKGTGSGSDSGGEVFFAENTGLGYGFTLKYDGSANLYSLMRHENSVGGTAVYTVPRASGILSFAVTPTVSGTALVLTNDSRMSDARTPVSHALNSHTGTITSSDISDVAAFSQSGTYASLRAQATTYGDVGAAPAAGNSSIVTVGTIGTGTWQGTAIAAGYMASHTPASHALNSHTGTITSSDISDVAAFSQSGTYASLRAQATTYGDVGAAPAAGNSSIVTVGTIGTGTWQGTAIAAGYMAAHAPQSHAFSVHSGTVAVADGGTGLTSGYNKTNWDLAHGWGDHDLVGYAMASAVIDWTNATEDFLTTGSLTAAEKHFRIPHPTPAKKKTHTLTYGSLEGPENGVYFRGKIEGNTIELPDYWVQLVDADSITAEITAFGKPQSLYIKKIADNKVIIGKPWWSFKKINAMYIVRGTRKDVAKLKVEQKNA
jgi:hypothetical protein